MNARRCGRTPAPRFPGTTVSAREMEAAEPRTENREGKPPDAESRRGLCLPTNRDRGLRKPPPATSPCVPTEGFLRRPRRSRKEAQTKSRQAASLQGGRGSDVNGEAGRVPHARHRSPEPGPERAEVTHRSPWPRDLGPRAQAGPEWAGPGDSARVQRRRKAETRFSGTPRGTRGKGPGCDTRTPTAGGTSRRPRRPAGGWEGSRTTLALLTVLTSPGAHTCGSGNPGHRAKAHGVCMGQGR